MSEFTECVVHTVQLAAGLLVHIGSQHSLKLDCQILIGTDSVCPASLAQPG